ncbi:adenine-specific DNA-methyltransferase [Marinobacter sp. LV10MA510-1]|nr:adenine-specific DNA-methyltransferase [Marinobacter sp. LV10MA510-1]
MLLDSSNSLVPEIEQLDRFNCDAGNFYYPKTRYYGSKKRVIEWVLSLLQPLNYHTILDAFGGTGLVSLSQKIAGKKVYYNEILKSSNYTAKSILADHTAIEEKDILEFCGSVVPNFGFISKKFQGFYYTDFENSWLDGAALSLKRYAGLKNVQLTHCLLQACLQKRPFNIFHRRNLNFRLNCNRNTKFGNWKTWEKTFQELMLDAVSELGKANFRGKHTVEFLEPSDASSISSVYDLVYLDPPYISNGSGGQVDYLDRYHFLEGFVSYDTWPYLIDENSRIGNLKKSAGLYEWNRKSTFRDRLYSLVDAHKKSIVVLSYVSSGYPSQKDLISYFQKKFKKVVVSSCKLNHVLSPGSKTEIIIIGLP